MALRMDRAASSADTIARWLVQHPLVTKVNYPGLPGCPGHAVHAGQASAGGSLLSFETGRCACMRTCCLRACIHRAAVTCCMQTRPLSVRPHMRGRLL